MPKDKLKTHIEMKKIIIENLDENILTIKNISKNLTDVITNVAKMIIDSYNNGGKIILFGNGGSAADAQHIAAEFVGRFKLERDSLPAISLSTNTSIITAIANDYAYDEIFSRQLESIANDKDIIIAITTSGNSRNILNAVEFARSKNIKVVGMTGRNGGKLKDLTNVIIRVPSDNTPRIQEAHITIGHIICELVERELFEKIKN